MVLKQAKVSAVPVGGRPGPNRRTRLELWHDLWFREGHTAMLLTVSPTCASVERHDNQPFLTPVERLEILD